MSFQPPPKIKRTITWANAWELYLGPALAAPFVLVLNLTIWRDPR